MSEDWTPVATAAQRTLDELPEVVAALTRVIREHVPEYALVSDEQLSAATTRNIRDLLHALRDRRHLTAAELADFTATVEERARNGVPVDEYLRAVTTAEAGLWQQLWLRADGVSQACTLEAFTLRFANVNAVTRVTVSAHRRIEVASARADQERRAGALRVLLQGGLGPDDAREHLARLGLADAAYFVVRARSRGGLDNDRVAAALGKRGAQAAFVLWGEDTVGLVRDCPVASTGLTVGVAGPIPVAQLGVAHQQASIAFETAWSLGLEGAYDLASLGIRAAVQASPEVGQVLRERYLVPLVASGSLGHELLTTIRAHLECGGRRETTAKRLHLHQNTVGYRLNRFCELTGADLSDLTTLAELHWLFTDLDLRPGP